MEKTCYVKNSNHSLYCGYSSSIIGKWHLSKNASDATTMGVDYNAGLVMGAVSDYSDWQLNENSVNAQSTEYCTKKFTDLGIDWIKKQNNPWFCWMAYTAPHTPLNLPPNHMHSQGNLPSDDASINTDPVLYFMAMMESLAYEMGRILDSLPQAERENTIVIFIGDNGSLRKVIQDQYTKSQTKGKLYQGGTHVPLIVSGKGVSRSGERETRLIQTTDLFTTIAEIAGIDKDSYEDSFSFYSTFSSPDNSANARKYNYTEIDPIIYTIRNSRYKLIQFDDNKTEFYNLVTDPYEKSNLIGGTLSQEEEDAKAELENAVADIRK